MEFFKQNSYGLLLYQLLKLFDFFSLDTLKSKEASLNINIK